MKKLSLIALLIATQSFAAKVGDLAPQFSGVDALSNKEIKLSDLTKKDAKHSGYTVVEWYNKDCPFVKKHYGPGNMQKLQKEWTAKGVNWVTVNSSAEGKQGNVNAAQAKEDLTQKGAAPTAFLIDDKGTIGKLYGAETTPHMFIISPEGKLVYNGAIDDNTTLDAKENTKNYISQALSEALAGKKISVASSKPYGCGVKY